MVGWVIATGPVSALEAIPVDIDRTAWGVQDYERAISAPAFAELDPATQHLILAEAATSELSAGHLPEAAQFATRAADSIAATDQDWFQLLEIGDLAKDSNGQIIALTGLAEKFPDAVRRLDEKYCWHVIGMASRQTDTAPYLRLLDALFGASWASDRGDEPDEQWVVLARLLIEQGRLDRAGEVIGRITDPSYLTGIRADRRYDPVTSQPHFSVDAQHVCAKTFTRLVEKMRREPRSLEVVLAVAESALGSGRADLALAVLDPVMSRLALPDDDEAGFDDVKQWAVWVRNRRADALLALGQVPEAMAEYDATLRAAQESGDAAGQTINVAEQYMAMGEPEKALALVTGLESLSPYGRMVVELVRLRAGLQLGDRASAAAALDYIKAHAKDAPSVLTSALASKGDANDVAKSFIRRLEDPGTRLDALVKVYFSVKEADLPDPPKRIRSAVKWSSTVARSDVKRALAAVSRPIDEPPFRCEGAELRDPAGP